MSQPYLYRSHARCVWQALWSWTVEKLTFHFGYDHADVSLIVFQRRMRKIRSVPMPKHEVSSYLRIQGMCRSCDYSAQYCCLFAMRISLLILRCSAPSQILLFTMWPTLVPWTNPLRFLPVFSLALVGLRSFHLVRWVDAMQHFLPFPDILLLLCQIVLELLERNQRFPNCTYILSD